MTSDFAAFFKAATAAPGREPYPYQLRLATGAEFPTLMSVPTGLGKTAAVVLSYLYRRFRHPEDAVRKGTPLRLVYVLPMRVLASQVRDEALRWIENLQKAGLLASEAPRVHLLMGGHVDDTWDLDPERAAIIIGTQDQLLSRALNRGYAMSRFRWPLHFGLLHNDALWVADEVQLMGVGAVTMAQLQGLRDRLGAYGPARTLWMSATLDPATFATIDYPVPDGGFATLSLSDEERRLPAVSRRVNARKPLEKASIAVSKAAQERYARELADAVLMAHQPKSLTLVILNRVARAQGLFEALRERLAKMVEAAPELALIHARMRPCDRAGHEAVLFGAEAEAGRIVVATQTVEAGVDVSARVLFTELAPWDSLVQRFGRCNRYGEQTDARIYWIDIDGDVNQQLPYEGSALDAARAHLNLLSDAGPASLAGVAAPPRKAPVRPVLRRKDLLDLFDTTPDLLGNDLDVSSYIRDGEDTDVFIFWRTIADQPPPELPGAVRDELCAVGINAVRAFLKKHGPAWRFDFLAGEWQKAPASEIRPGQTLLLDVQRGGYSSDFGWTGEAKHGPVMVLSSESEPESAVPGDRETEVGTWLALPTHTDHVVEEMQRIETTLHAAYPAAPWPALHQAARHHDWGKAAHPFQAMLGRAGESTLWAKSDGRGGGRHAYRDAEGRERKGFRHELASALAYLKSAQEPEASLVAYLIAAHHGKVRMSIRSQPDENPPPEADRFFARGVWHGDRLPEVDLGGGVVKPAIELDLSPMHLGDGPLGPSWLARALALREAHGPFKLAFLETLFRAADGRASAKERAT